MSARESLRPVRTYETVLVCDCGFTMERQDAALLTNPPKHVYRCRNRRCANTETSTHVYPRIDYEWDHGL